MPSSWPAWEVFLYDWQALIAGGVALIAGFLAWRGARGQITDAQAARAESDRRRRAVVEWAARAEGRRLSTEAQNLWSAMQSPNDAIRRAGVALGDQLYIPSSPLLRGEREDIALLDDETRALLEQAGNALNDYNASMAALRVGTVGDRQVISSEKLAALDRLKELGNKLSGDHRAEPR
jgi:hypothetical protein